MKIEARRRLHAVTVKPDAYPDAQGIEDLAALQKLFARSQRRIGKDSRGHVFWWVGTGQRYLVCTSNDQAVAYIELLDRTNTVYTYPGSVKGRSVSVMFTHPDYRGKGLMLGMHQYLITQFNLVSDDVYSPEGLKLWKHLQKLGHNVEVSDGYPNNEKSWTKPGVRLFIRRGQ